MRRGARRVPRFDRALQPRDLGAQQRNPLGEFGGGEVVEILADLMRGARLGLCAEYGFLVEVGMVPGLRLQEAAMNPPPRTRACGSRNS